MDTEERIKEHVDLISDIRGQWDLAESDIKQAEQVCDSVVTPAIKELRYAGRRIVDALHSKYANEDEQKIINYLNDAKFDCLRARHDAIDAATSMMAIKLDLVGSKLGHDVALRCYPEFPGLFSDICLVREKISESRKYRNDREKIYASIEATDFPNLVKKFTAFKSCEPIMFALAKKNREQFAWSIGIAAASLVFAIVSVIIAICAWIHPIAAG